MAIYIDDEDDDDDYDYRSYDPYEDNDFEIEEEEGGSMIVSAIPANPQERGRIMADWLLTVLATPTLTGRTNMPTVGRCVIFIENHPRLVFAGAWQIDQDHVYVASERGGVPPIDRLSILAAIAAATGAAQDPRIPDAFTSKLVQIIKDSTASLYASIAVSVVPPKRIAVNMANAQVAAELNDRWSLPGGAPAEVDNSWITMDL